MVNKAEDFGSTTSGFQTFQINENDKKLEDTDGSNFRGALNLLENCRTHINKAKSETTTGTAYAKTAIEKVEEAVKVHNTAVEELKKLGTKNDTNKTQYEELEKKANEFMTKIQLGNDTYDYVGDSNSHFGTTYRVLNGYGIHMKTNRRTSSEFKENIRSHNVQYSCMGYFDNSKTGHGMERLKNAHYYVGQFKGGKRENGAYIMDQNTKYIGEFRSESFNGYGCFYENGSYLFSCFGAKSYGPVADKIVYPLISIKSNNSDIRYYTERGKYYVFENNQKQEILNIFNQINIKGTFDTLNIFQEGYRWIENIVSENKYKLAFGVALLTFGFIYKKYKNFWKKFDNDLDKKMRGESSSDKPITTSVPFDANIIKTPETNSANKTTSANETTSANKTTSANETTSANKTTSANETTSAKSIKEESSATPVKTIVENEAKEPSQIQSILPVYNAKLLRGKKKDQLLEIGKGFGLSEENWRIKTNKQIENAILSAQRTAKRGQKSNRKKTSRRRSVSSRR